MNKLIIWQSQGHEIGLHHHELSAFGVWDGYTNYSMAEIDAAGRDTTDFIGNMDSLYNYIQQISSLPLLTIGVEDSVEMPSQTLYQTRGHSISDGYSNPFSYTCNSIDYFRITHCFFSSLSDEELIENLYSSMTGYEIIGSNTHVYNFVDEPERMINFFKFLNLMNISSYTVSDLLENCNPNSISEKDYSSKIQVFPNPATNYVNINSENDEIITLLVINSVGQIIFQKNNTKNFILSTQNYPKGLYFIMASTEKSGFETKKIIIE